LVKISKNIGEWTLLQVSLNATVRQITEISQQKNLCLTCGKKAVLDEVQDGGFKVMSCTFSEFVDAALILLVKSSISESRSSSFALAHQFDPVVKQNAIKAHQCPHQ